MQITKTANKTLDQYGQSDLYNRLPPEVKNFFELYSSINLVGSFLQNCWMTNEYHTVGSRATIARICSAIDKGLTGLTVMATGTTSILVDIHLAKIQQAVRDLEWYMILHRHHAPYASISDGGMNVQLTPDGFYILTQFELWKLTENVIEYSSYELPFDINSYLGRLILGFIIELPQ